MGAQIDIKQIAPDGATSGQALVFNGTNWVPGVSSLVAIPNVAAIPAAPRALNGVGVLAGYYGSDDGGGQMLLWEPASAAAANNFTVFDPGAGGGRWLHLDEGLPISVKAAGAHFDGVTDDSPFWQTGINTLASTSVTLLGPTGISVIAAPLLVRVHGLVIQLGAATRLASTIPGVGFFDAIFAADGLQSGTTGTLAATPAIGAVALGANMTAAPVVGRAITVGHGVSLTTYVIKTVAGVGPYTIGIDRPVAVPWVSTDVVTELIDWPQNVTVRGEAGTAISGTGNQKVEYARAFRMTISHLHQDALNGQGVGAAFGFDVGCWECVCEDSSADMTGVASAPGFYMQSNERSVLRRFVTRGGDFGAQMADCYSSSFEDVWAYGSNRGVIFETLPNGATASLGNRQCSSYGGGAVGCGIGLNIYGSIDLSIESFTAIGCTGNACQIEAPPAAGPATTNVTLTGCAFVDSVVGLFVGLGVKGTKVADIDLSRNTTSACNINDDIEIDGLRAFNLTGATAVVFTGGSLHRMSHFDVSSSAAGGISVFCSGTRTELTSGRITQGAGGGSICLRVSAGVAILNDIQCIGGGATYGLFIDAGATVRLGPGCTFAAGVPINVSAGAFLSRGTFVSTGVLLAIAWPDVKATDDISITQTAGAPSTVMPLVVITAGVGFSVTVPAGTFTYNIQ